MHFFLNSETMEHVRLGAASCFVFSGEPKAPFRELQSLFIERDPLSGYGNSNNNSRPPLAGRRPLTTRAGAGGGIGEVGGEPERRQLAVVHLRKAACVAQTAP